jgi:hypothetical protein
MRLGLSLAAAMLRCDQEAIDAITGPAEEVPDQVVELVNALGDTLIEIARDTRECRKWAYTEGWETRLADLMDVWITGLVSAGYNQPRKDGQVSDDNWLAELDESLGEVAALDGWPGKCGVMHGDIACGMPRRRGFSSCEYCMTSEEKAQWDAGRSVRVANAVARGRYGMPEPCTSPLGDFIVAFSTSAVFGHGRISVVCPDCDFDAYVLSLGHGYLLAWAHVSSGREPQTPHLSNLGRGPVPGHFRIGHFRSGASEPYRHWVGASCPGDDPIRGCGYAAEITSLGDGWRKARAHCEEKHPGYREEQE